MSSVLENRHVTSANSKVLTTGSRLIDGDQRVRAKPMRVLVLGLCRTGTSSIFIALEKLGYTPHHMSCLIENTSDIPYWQEAVEVTYFPDSERPAQLRSQPPYGRAEFDKLLANYDAVTDIPSALFVEQLVGAYPDAKVVLTNRPYESWVRSMEDTIWWLYGSKLARFCLSTGIGPVTLLGFTRLNAAIWKVNNGYHMRNGPKAKTGYERHSALVRSIVPKDNLLEFGPKFEWEPLCKFLGKDIPNEPYPWSNESKVMKRRVRGAYASMAMYVGVVLALPVGLSWVVWRWRDAITVFSVGIFRRD